MSDVVALADTLSDTLVVDPSTQPEDSTPPAFELNRLPPELRENVIVEAALAASLGERKRIMLVNHEFKEAAIPHAWSTIFRYSQSSTSLDSFEEALPRYAQYVKTACFYFWNEEYREPSDCEQYVRVLAGMPYVEEINLRSGFFHVVAQSPHLASLTRLGVHAGSLDLSALDLATLISRCPNVEDLDFNMSDYDELDDLPLLVAAIASRSRLATLNLEYTTLVTSDTAAANWICPLARFKVNYFEDAGVSTLRTFFSHFSNTLAHLDLTGCDFAATDVPMDDSPFPLPRLAHLKLGHDPFLYEYRRQEMQPLGLFDDSPIKTVHIQEGGIPGRADRKSIYQMARNFIEVHQTTLKSFHLIANACDGNVLLSEPRDVAAYAKRLGIEFEVEFSREIISGHEVIENAWVSGGRIRCAGEGDKESLSREGNQ